jgi:hypothetical protein
MSMSSISRAAGDIQLQSRIMSAVWREIVYNADAADSWFGKQVSAGFAQFGQLHWQVAVDTEAAYEGALLNGRGAPGFDTDIITDAALSASVVAHWPQDPNVMVTP